MNYFFFIRFKRNPFFITRGNGKAESVTRVDIFDYACEQKN